MDFNSRKIDLAYAILTLVKCEIQGRKQDDKKSMWVDTFSNCREQGFLIHACVLDEGNMKELTIAFSENRNSDDIVVYYCNEYVTGNFPDNFWDSAKYFLYNRQGEVAEYISKIILEL